MNIFSSNLEPISQVFISDYFFKSSLAKDFSYADIQVIMSVFNSYPFLVEVIC